MLHVAHDENQRTLWNISMTVESKDRERKHWLRALNSWGPAKTAAKNSAVYKCGLKQNRENPQFIECLNILRVLYILQTGPLKTHTVILFARVRAISNQ